MGLGIATGVKCASAAPPAVTYLGTNVFSGIDIGPARNDRMIVVVGYGENDAGGNMSDCTFNGVSGSLIINPTMSDCFGMAAKFVTSGSSLSIGPTQYGGSIFDIYMITGLLNGLYHANSASSGGTSLNVSLNTPAANCAIIMGARSRSAMGTYSNNSSGGTAGMAINSQGNLGGGGNISWATLCGLGNKSGSSVSAGVSNGSAFDTGYGGGAVFY